MWKIIKKIVDIISEPSAEDKEKLRIFKVWTNAPEFRIFKNGFGEFLVYEKGQSTTYNNHCTGHFDENGVLYFIYHPHVRDDIHFYSLEEAKAGIERIYELRKKAEEHRIKSELQIVPLDNQ